MIKFTVSLVMASLCSVLPPTAAAAAAVTIEDVGAPKRPFESDDEERGEDGGGAAASDSSDDEGGDSTDASDDDASIADYDSDESIPIRADTSQQKAENRVLKRMMAYGDALQQCIYLTPYLVNSERGDALYPLQQAMRKTLAIGSAAGDAQTSLTLVRDLINDLSTAISFMSRGQPHHPVDIAQRIRAIRDVIATGNTLRAFDDITDQRGRSEGVPKDVLHITAFLSNRTQVLGTFEFLMFNRVTLSDDSVLHFASFDHSPSELMAIRINGGLGWISLSPALEPYTPGERCFVNGKEEACFNRPPYRRQAPHDGRAPVWEEYVHNGPASDPAEIWGFTSTMIAYRNDIGQYLKLRGLEELFGRGWYENYKTAKCANRLICLQIGDGGDGGSTAITFEALADKIVYSTLKISVPIFDFAIDNDKVVWVAPKAEIPRAVDAYLGGELVGSVQLNRMYAYRSRRITNVLMESADKEGIWILTVAERHPYMALRARVALRPPLSA